jgi:transcriptional regulator with GAF, ATPase, and Fis domain
LSLHWAITQKRGNFEAADGGMIFLNEIRELSLGKLLRVLQEHTFERVCALDGDVAERSFRADLFYRLNAFRIHLPPLRSRQSEQALKASHGNKSGFHCGAATLRAECT